METTTFILLAGGASSRMGGNDKLLEPVRGMPLIADRARACIAVKSGPVIAILPPDRPDRDAALKGIDVQRRHTNGTAYGMSHSLKLGLKSVETSSAMIVLADMPDVTTDDLTLILKESMMTSAKVLRGASNGAPGHPVLIRKALFSEMDELSADEGASKILARYRDQTRLIDLPETHATCDLDTVDDWMKWRTQNPDL